MTVQAQDVLFFIRAYNDMDIQFSLIQKFSEDPRFTVRVMFYTTDGFISHPEAHEVVAYFKKHSNITFQSVFELKECPARFRMAYKAKSFFYELRRRFGGDIFILRALDASARILLKPALSDKNPSWLLRASKAWNPAIVFIDEVLFQPGRTIVADNIVPALIGKGANAYVIVTGHRGYTYVRLDNSEEPSAYKPSQARRYFVPSENNARINKILFPQENVTVGGNLRMDAGWIKFLHDKIITVPPQLPQGPVKIVMMLSKMSYGVEEEQLKETIRALSRLPNVALVIKPHTRGMKFDFMDRKEIGRTYIADTIPSGALIEWADLVLGTGSSIVFHAMLRGKVTGLLKYCQRLETIFDEHAGCKRFDAIEELVSYAEAGAPPLTAEEQKDLKAFIAHEIHGDIPGGNTAEFYKNTILDDLGAQIPQPLKKNQNR